MIGAMLIPNVALAQVGVHEFGEFRMVFVLLALGHLVNVWSGACGTVLLFSVHRRKLLGHTALNLFGLVSLLAVQAWLGFDAIGLALAASLSVGVRFLSLAYLTFRFTGIRTDARWPRRHTPPDNSVASGAADLHR